MLVAAVTRLAPIRAPWALAGGWALELAYDLVPREHADVDIAIFRDDQQHFRRAFEGYTCEQVVGGAMRPWSAAMWIAPPIHDLHIRSPADGRPVDELRMNERDASRWVYRRDASVWRAIDAAVQMHHGIPVLAREIVLLYKSKAPRPTDQADFKQALPVLSAGAAAWLREALELASPGHPWAAALSARDA